MAIRMTRQRVLQSAAATAGMTLAAACGAGRGGSTGTAGSGAEAPKAGRKAVTLQYWSRMGAGASRPYVETGEFEDQRLPVFMEKHAPVKVERTIISNHGELLQKLTVGFVSGQGPDVFNVGSPGVSQMAGPGFVLPLDSYSRVKKEASDFFQSGLNIGTYKNKLYGLTYYADMRIMLYRKDRLAEAGLPTDRKSLPKTWDQFREVTKKLARWDGGQLARIGFDVPKNDDSFFLLMVRQLGKDSFNADLTKAQFDGAEGERALQTIVDFLHRDRIDAFERPSIPRGVPPIASDVVGSVFRNTQEIGNVRAVDLDPQRLLAPEFTPEFGGQTTATGYLGGTWVLAGKQNRDLDATLDLLLFLGGYDQVLGVAERFTAVPPRKSADKSVQDPLLRPFYEAQDKAWSVPGHPKYEQIRVKIREVMPQVLKREKSVKEALSEMAAFTNTTLNSA
ncbi:MAG: extracellular solute-binding protein [Chloroflexi bacterium]|nr:extracellular solute-binding protein [Chloroflexota bacterium]